MIRDSTAWDFKMWPLAVLTGFFIRKCMAVLPGRKKLAVIIKWPYYQGGRKVGFHCIVEPYLTAKVSTFRRCPPKCPLWFHPDNTATCSKFRNFVKSFMYWRKMLSSQLLYAISALRLFVNENSCSKNVFVGVFVITALKSWNLSLSL